MRWEDNEAEMKGRSYSTRLPRMRRKRIRRKRRREKRS